MEPPRPAGRGRHGAIGFEDLAREGGWQILTFRFLLKFFRGKERSLPPSVRWVGAQASRPIQQLSIRSHITLCYYIGCSVASIAASPTSAKKPSPADPRSAFWKLGEARW